MTDCRAQSPARITRGPESLVIGDEIVIGGAIDVVGRIKGASVTRAMEEIAGEERVVLRLARAQVASARRQCASTA
jgi:hypothetical protein